MLEPAAWWLGADAIIVKLRLQLNEDGSLIGRIDCRHFG